MSDFEVIVIGGGPAGCYAALTAAVKGLRVALFEEHRAIGWPRHDPGWLMESQFAKSLISAVGIPWCKVKEFRVCQAESGDLIEKSPLGGYLVRRDLLEREIAALAVRAGAHLYLKTKVTGLVRREGKVEGVETRSDIIPVAKGEVFICADGIRSSLNGFAVKEGLCKSGESETGVSYLLANADISAGIAEHFLSADPLLNHRFFWGHGKGVTFFYVPSPTALQELRAREDNVVSRRIKDAYPVEISGVSRAFSGKRGMYFKNMVQDNVMFIGDASGGSGNVHGMIQGQFAGTVAASAMKEKDISEKRLSEYQDLVLDTLGKAPFVAGAAREGFGSFGNWFREFESATEGIEATEPTRLA